ncbi:MAG: UbiD family decarboxylase, partial [Thermoplasmata archaeon]|nr:UbiD family decarboxylase [Thermoplasmata archaeon]
MAFRSLGEFLTELERRGDLVRISSKVSRDLEVTEITRRTLAKDGPALLFEKVEGATMPVAMNVLGSTRRIALALNVDTLEEAAARIGSLTHLRPPAGVVAALKDLGGTLELLETVRSLGPKRVSKAPCQAVEVDHVDLNQLPILRCWPGDAGRTVTFPVVVTKDPDTGEPHTGVYRLQQYGPDTLGFHAQLHRVGASNYRKWAARGERMPVAAVIGVDPATVLSGLAPVP